MKELPNEMVVVFDDGEPCRHPGCANHIIHECEGCGRIGARGKVEIPADVYRNWKLFSNNWKLLFTWGPSNGNE